MLPVRVRIATMTKRRGHTSSKRTARRRFAVDAGFSCFPGHFVQPEGGNQTEGA